MQVRQHRGTFEESLKTITTIQPTREAVLAWINKEVFGANNVTDFDLHPYPDSRMMQSGWLSQYIITLPDGKGGSGAVLGFCNAVPEDYDKVEVEAEMTVGDLKKLIPKRTVPLLPKELDNFLHHWYIGSAQFEAALKTNEKIIAAVKEAFAEGAEVTVKINRVGDPEISITYNKPRYER